MGMKGENVCNTQKKPLNNHLTNCPIYPSIFLPAYLFNQLYIFQRSIVWLKTVKLLSIVLVLLWEGPFRKPVYRSKSLSGYLHFEKLGIWFQCLFFLMFFIYSFLLYIPSIYKLINLSLFSNAKACESPPLSCPVEVVSRANGAIPKHSRLWLFILRFKTDRETENFFFNAAT